MEWGTNKTIQQAAQELSEAQQKLLDELHKPAVKSTVDREGFLKRLLKRQFGIKVNEEGVKHEINANSNKDNS